MTMKTHTNTTSRACTPWLPAVASAVLALAAGCMDDLTAAPAEPVADDTQAITVPAGAETSAALGITMWRYIPTADEGLVVRGSAPTICHGLGSGSQPATRSTSASYTRPTRAHWSRSRATARCAATTSCGRW